MNVSHNLYQITLPTPFGVGPVHTYLLIDNQITLFDAGIYTEEAWDCFNQQLNELSLKIEDIDQIFLTHHHPDHTGLISNFSQHTPIVSHPNVDVWLKRNEEYFTRYERFFREQFLQWGIPRALLDEIASLKGSLHYAGTGEVTIPVEHLDHVPGHADWTVFYTPGHAQTHVALFREKDRVLIGGDLLLENTSSNPLLEGPYGEGNRREKPLIQYRESLKQMQQLDVLKVLPGHGPIITNVNELIDERLQAIEKRSMLVKKLLKNEPQSAYELSKELYPRQKVGQLLLIMSQVIGWIDVLLESHDIIEYKDHGIYYYKVVE